MQLHIRPTDLVPIYRQITYQITDAVASGRLAAGHRLPSQRELAEQLVISPLAVKKAYEALRRDGIVSTRRGRGTFIAAPAPVIDPAARRRRLHLAARRLLAQAHLTGASLDEVRSLIREVDDQLRRERAARREARSTAAP